MSYRIAGIDVHKRLLAVVIADVAVEGAYQFARRRVGTNPSDLRALAEWLVAQEVEEVVQKGLDEPNRNGTLTDRSPSTASRCRRRGVRMVP